MSQIITIGKRLTPKEHIALVEPFDTSGQSKFNPTRDYRGRVVLLNRDSILIETDVDSEEKARKYYSDRIPVILVNNREVVGYPPEDKWVKIALKNAHRLDMRPI